MTVLAIDDRSLTLILGNELFGAKEVAALECKLASGCMCGICDPAVKLEG